VPLQRRQDRAEQNFLDRVSKIISSKMDEIYNSKSTKWQYRVPLSSVLFLKST